MPGEEASEPRSRAEETARFSSVYAKCVDAILSKDNVVMVGEGLDKAGMPAFIVFATTKDVDLQQSYEGFKVIVIVMTDDPLLL